MSRTALIRVLLAALATALAALPAAAFAARPVEIFDTGDPISSDISLKARIPTWRATSRSAARW